MLKTWGGHGPQKPRTQQARRALAAKREARGAVPNRNYTADAEKSGAFGGFEAGDFVREKLGKKEKSFVLDAVDGVADGVLAPPDPRVSSAARAAPVAGGRHLRGELDGGSAAAADAKPREQGNTEAAAAGSSGCWHARDQQG